MSTRSSSSPWRNERAGEYDRARELYERGFELSPGYHDVRIGLARIRLAQGDAEKARTVAAAVLQEAPSHPEARLALAMALRATGDLEEAKEQLLEGLQLRSTYGDFYRLLGGIAAEQGHDNEAADYYRRARELAP